jgi:hypothetical protein
MVSDRNSGSSKVRLIVSWLKMSENIRREASIKFQAEKMDRLAFVCRQRMDLSLSIRRRLRMANQNA